MRSKTSTHALVTPALARRALQFKTERGRLPPLTAADAWKKRWRRAWSSCAAINRNKAMNDLSDRELLEALGVEATPQKKAAKSAEGARGGRF